MKLTLKKLAYQSLVAIFVFSGSAIIVPDNADAGKRYGGSYSRSYSAPKSYAKPRYQAPKPKAAPQVSRPTTPRPPPSALGLQKPTTKAKPPVSVNSSSALGLSKPGSASGTTTSTSPVKGGANTGLGLTKPNVSKSDMPPTTAMGLSKPATTTPAKTALPKGSRLDNAQAKAASAQTLKKFNSSRGRFEKPAKPVDENIKNDNKTYQNATSRYRDRDDFYSSRERGYDRMGYSQPAYATAMAPSYGVWDVMFLTMMMQNINNAQYANWAYANRNDPAIQEFRAEAARQAETNAELRAQLAAMDAKMNEMEANGVQPVSDGFLPEGVEPSMAIAPEHVMQGGAGVDQVSVEKDEGMGFITWLLIILGVGGIGFGVYRWKFA